MRTLLLLHATYAITTTAATTTTLKTKAYQMMSIKATESNHLLSINDIYHK